MATKDWKLYRTNQFDNIKKEKRIMIESNPRIKNSKWDVKLYSSKGTKRFLGNQFKTKKQALAYARAYMRKH